ncbi:MAG: tetraacyldisaccharide 4'-kinase [Bacteroidales bacterium]|nr:tetraacyldisaccharide 4'-kinase [Bacteroidales bacterium]
MASRKLRHTLFFLLYPLSILFRFITSVRNKLFDLKILKSESFDFPVISVGNITVGGTGKTPHVEYLLGLLQEKFRIAFLSRGYKRKTRGFILADGQASPASIGDEPYQVYSKFKKVKVAVDEDRVHGIRSLRNADKGVQCVILDDAYQHRRVQAGVSILLIDYHRPMHKDFLLPFGDLRESRHGIHRANIVIVTKVPHEIKPIEKRLWIKELDLFPYQFLYFTTFRYSDLLPVFKSSKHKLPLNEFRTGKYSVLLVTGIANTIPLEQEMIKYSSHFEHLRYADHHSFTAPDLKKIKAKLEDIPGKYKIVITTEKDAVKLSTLPMTEKGIGGKIYYLPAKIEFLDNKGKQFDETIYDFVAKNKRISRLHT